MKKAKKQPGKKIEAEVKTPPSRRGGLRLMFVNRRMSMAARKQLCRNSRNALGLVGVVCLGWAECYADTSSMEFAYAELFPLHVVTVAWESDSAGAVSDTSDILAGTLVKAITYPDTTTAYRPSSNYDIALAGVRGVNVLGETESTLANQDSATVVETYFLVKNASAGAMAVQPVVNEQVVVSVTNAGVHRRGWLYLYIRE